MRLFKHLTLSIFSLVTFVSFSIGQVKSKAEVKTMLTNSNNPAAKSLLNDGTEYTVKDSHTDDNLGIEHVYLQQTYKSINVYNVIKSMVFKNGVLQYSSGKFITDISLKAPSEQPAIASNDAVSIAATYLGLNKPTSLSEVSNTFTTDKKIVYSNGGIAKSNINTELVWVSNDGGKTVHLAWNVQIEPVKGADYWHVRVDAASGAIINKGNYTVYEKNNTKVSKKNIEQNLNQLCDDEISGLNHFASVTRKMSPPPPPPTVTSATYKVVPYPDENPYNNGPTIVTNPWTTNATGGFNTNATTYGWHFDGTTNYKTSRGNNVYVYDDSLNKNAPGRPDTSTTAIPSLTFNFTPDLKQDPTLTQNRQFAEANLFYWNNLMHDMSYQYGFTEAAGNFQNNNLGRGGKQADYVHAEAQDGSGTDNSNFSALPDGQTGREQMYLFTAQTTGAYINILTPSAIAGNYNYYEGAMSTANKLSTVGPVTGQFVYYNDDAAGTSHYACSGPPTNSLAGKIALIDRNTCNFTVKVKAAQTAGAIAVVMVNRVDSIITMSGSDNTITIPAVLIIKSDGDKIKAQLAAGQNVTGTIQVASAGVRFDGDLDNTIVTHEYTHGISLRLTGGASTTSCLDNKEEAGEGWSDYYAMMMTTDWTAAALTDGTKNRYIGSYAVDQNPNVQVGVRTYPYTTDTTVDKHTYADLGDANQGEVHYIGEVWCSALWDMTWNIINQEGVINGNIFDATAKGGNTVALQLVTEGLKLQPCSPGFIDGRDAILAADSILYNSAHKCAIWAAFARRGMGYSASQGSSDSCGDETVAFDVPPCTLPVSLLDFSGSAGSSKVLLKWTTAEETNLSGYSVEHSVDGTHWTSIGFVNAKNVAGNSQYSLNDNQPSLGSNYYRLKIMDKNGKLRYSKTLSISITGKTGFSIYPNPVKEVINLELVRNQSEKIEIRIVDVVGRVLQTTQVQAQIGTNNFKLNTEKLSKGTYFIVVDNGTSEVKQFVKD